MNKICFQCGYIVKYQYTPTKNWTTDKCIWCRRVRQVTDLIVFNLSLIELSHVKRTPLPEPTHQPTVNEEQPQPITETVEE